MKYSYFGFGMLLFGSIGLVIIVMLQSVTINNDSEYYNLKEAMQAAMLESVDYVCYRVDGKTVSTTGDNDCGYLLKISEQKFVDNFTRRFVATVGGDATKYTLNFYDIIESPPKASVVIKGNTNNYGMVSENQELTITNSLSGILELKKGIVDKYGYFKKIDFDFESNMPDIRIKDISSGVEDVVTNEVTPADDYCASNPSADGCSSGDAGEEVDGEEEDDALDAED